MSVPLRLTTPTRPGEKMSRGMMETFALPGESTPGQLGPMSVASLFAMKSATRIMSWTGMPSVMQQMVLMPESNDSKMASAANGGGTKITLAFAPVSSVASCTVLKTGTPSWSLPPLPGVTPATTFVPLSSILPV